MDLQKTLANLPEQPGVYIYKNAEGQVIYVGKAASLKNRVKQYFSASGDGRATVEKMVPQIEQIDFVVTGSVQDALLLECNLIKKYLPKYNILLKDNKTYPYICVSTSQKYPRVFSTRHTNNKDMFFGPYSSANDVRASVDALRKAFPFRSCNKEVANGKKAKRPCLFYGLGECLAPCAYDVPEEEYNKNIKCIIDFLKGKENDVIDDLTSQMMEASENLEFERAAKLRNSVFALRSLEERRQVFDTDGKNTDVIAVAVSVNTAYAVLLSIRDGKLLNAVDFVLKKQSDDEASQILSSYISQYYSSATDIPHEIIVEVMPEFAEELEQWLTQMRGASVNIVCPQRGEKKQLMLLAKKNAVQKLNSHVDVRNAELEQLVQVLGLKSQPKRIEGFDISHLQGTNTVSSMVVFEDGKPKKSDYRHFKIKTVENIDDFRSMHETLSRRFMHIDEGDEKFGAKPDLILIDGGKGQLHFAYEAMCQMGITGIEMISLAEKNEEIYTLYSNDPIVLPRDNKALQLLQRVRDEAHRFAISYNKLLREKTSLISVIEDVPGVGPKKRRALMQHFKTVGDIRKATPEELASVDGINMALALKIKEYVGDGE